MARKVGNHSIYTVSELIDQLRKVPPHYEVGINSDKGTRAHSLQAIKVDESFGVVDLYLQTSYVDGEGFKIDDVEETPEASLDEEA